MDLNVRSVTVLLMVALLSVATVVGATLLSVGLIFLLRASFRSLVQLLAAVGEIIVALTAAVVSGRVLFLVDTCISQCMSVCLCVRMDG